ncbi:MAG: hypothetical protein IMZ57_06595 [Acidobacteria bacterium]|nr:hypothetical protein [Acidobacteriota bacterium]
MIQVKWQPLKGEWSIGLSERFETLLLAGVAKLLRRRDPYLNYSVAHAVEYYGEDCLRWVKHHLMQSLDLPVPYELIHDYRTDAVPSRWGTVAFSGTYELPPVLLEHRQRMVARMLREKRISDRNSPCPRVADLDNRDGSLTFSLQKSRYYDQVGTNLTLDYPIPDGLPHGGGSARTVREWDLRQCGITVPRPPSFQASRLANTIGVAVALSATDERGQVHYLKRWRTPRAPVYPATWHLPVSFALRWEDSIESRAGYDISDVIKFDLPDEVRAEASVSHDDFGPLIPLAFCRDLPRGGKPQFFCEMHSRLPYEQLIGRVKDQGREYKRQPRAETGYANLAVLRPSAELACYVALKLTQPGSVARA